MPELPDALKIRHADHPIETLFLKRWSPRAMSGAAVSQADMNRLFEAARWAPSSFNEQEWRFLYAHRNSAHWDKFFGLLMPANQTWCSRAGVLIVVVAKKTFTANGKPNRVHEFDAGAAFENLALQGAALGLVVHGMAGFSTDNACMVLNIPEDFAPLAMVAIGQPGNPDDLSAELRQREQPSLRKTVAEISHEGEFAF